MNEYEQKLAIQSPIHWQKYQELKDAVPMLEQEIERLRTRVKSLEGRVERQSAIILKYIKSEPGNST